MSVAAMEVSKAKKPTRCCDLVVRLTTGVTLSGKFHVPLATSSMIRPSDAVRDHPGGYLLLSEVTMRTGMESIERPAVLIRTEAIAVIELPPNAWSAETVSPIVDAPSKPAGPPRGFLNS